MKLASEKASVEFDTAKINPGKIKQNLFWAFVYNISGIPIAAGVLYLGNTLLTRNYNPEKL